MEPSLYSVYFRPAHFASRSGLEPLAEATGSKKIKHGCYWQAGARINWRIEDWMRRTGQSYYRSEWNYLSPIWGEYQIARQMNNGPGVAHFLFAEFAGPRRSKPFRKKDIRIAGTFHTSMRRLEQVIGNMTFDVYDSISVVSKTMLPFFIERGYPEDRLFVTLHGVDVDYFKPAEKRGDSSSKPMKALLVGATERDHAFAAELMKALPDGTMHLDVATRPEMHVHYKDAPNTNVLPHQSDAALLDHYQQADLLLMPLFDATANNALLESMACGTPVMTNAVGGVPEYVDAGCNYLMDDKNVDVWSDVLKSIAANRAALLEKRPAVRTWAESLSWASLLPDYHAMYQRAREGGR